ncbi:MAG: hypothetical protein D6732_18240 [Methanobacteriota archaeon]|nr:MAG: hypothetical protein D6732_18240 [Euryarchaeota archaeon]
MSKFPIPSLFREEEGYTVIEVLVALMVLLLVLVPVTHLLTYLISTETNRDIINATMLGESALEYCLLYRLFDDEESRVQMNGRWYIVERNVVRNSESQLVKITIRIIRLHQKRPILTLVYHYVPG